MTERTITLPTDPDAFWEFFAWPSKAPLDSLPYQVDCAAWLADGGFILENVIATASPGLTVGHPVLTGSGNQATLITVQVSSGIPNTIPVVALTLHLDSGIKVVRIAIEIEDELPDDLISTDVPGSPLTIGGDGITIGGQPITI